jgi:hypothetical protein
MFKFLLRISLFMLLAVLFCEAFFRFVMPAREYPRGYQDPETGVTKFDTTWATEGTGSFGPYCKKMGHWKLNNAGWNSTFDYHPREDESRPRIAVVGNSYIEGWAADVEIHFGAELHRMLDESVDVYSFGISGATFAQYLGMLPVIEEKYDPDVYVFILSEFGISRSLSKGFSPYRFYVEESEGGLELKHPRRVFVQNKYGRIVFRSAFARYLYFNKQILAKKLDVDVDEMSVGSRAAEPISPEYREAGRFFLESIAAAIPEDRVIFLADGNRKAIYEGLSEYAKGMDHRILEGMLGPKSMFSLIDLTGPFRADYEQNGVMLSPGYDPHWNNYAHSLAAEAVLPHIVAELKELGF